MKKLILISVMLLLAGTIVTAKEPKKVGKQKKPKPVAIEAVTMATPKTTKGEVVITGTLICISETLQKKGAKAECPVYGHRPGIKIEKIVFSGDWKPNPKYKGKWPPPDLPHPDPTYKGKIFSFIPSDNSAELIKEKNFGKKVIIVGKVYIKANIIEGRFAKFASKKK